MVDWSHGSIVEACCLRHDRSHHHLAAQKYKLVIGQDRSIFLMKYASESEIRSIFEKKLEYDECCQVLFSKSANFNIFMKHDHN